ncbi:DUF922 domain-containing protein [Corallincola luteus]|uniref:DUF922 domain-containing protein n=1 Tax=Corallincola luteus TaxID=1775177 RepID=A0ABY2AN09_9GAMM|nr:DUF922 domain-containing protein [Corallincola luteus]TCI04593.1 DUF922 domain-containing protein [Corallincola luteus]
MPFKLSILILAFTTLTSHASPQVSRTFDYYPVFLEQVSDLQEIGSILSKASPIITNGKKYRGHAHWNVKWKYRWKQKNGSCKVTKVNTTVELTYTMPEAVTLPLNKSLREKYLAYYDALLEHEYGHGDYAIAAAQEIETTLNRISLPGKCEGINSKLNSKAQAILDLHNEKSRQYDIATDHGKSQGASLH